MAATRRPPSHHSRPGSIAAVGFVLLAAAYMAVFIADGARPSGAILRDAVANALSALLAAVPAWVLCTRVPWRHGHRWWFLPMHLLGALGFIVGWYFTIAYTLAAAAWLTGAAWAPTLLRGPAMHWQAITGAVLYVAICGTCYTIEATREARRTAALLHRAEVSALRAQLDPHLLFNTLHSLLELVRSGDSRAEDAIDRFARVARYVSEGRTPERDIVPLPAEWHMAQDYVALESLRLGSRLTCRFELDDGLQDVMIPALSLQPLVENAIRHGIAPRPGAGHITISAQRHHHTVTLAIEDDGLGARASTRGSGTGLDLVRRRLVNRYGTALTFSAGPRVDADGWAVRASFPATVG